MQGDSALGRALSLVRDLRTRCPWDRAQTPQTLRPYLVEEALELDHAIQSDDPEALRDELGDVLLHLAFQIVIAEERSQFNAEVVTRSLEEKMWRRHPHLYGGAKDADHANWELVKRREPRGGGKRGTLAGLPPTLPPLLAAFSRQFPNVTLSVLVEPSREISNQVKAAALDCALIEGDSLPDLISVVVTHDELVLVVNSLAVEVAPVEQVDQSADYIVWTGRDGLSKVRK